MRTWLLMVVVVLLPALAWSAGLSARNPALGNPVGVGTVPVSSYRNGLLTTPIPIDATADLSMTGNIRDGKYFRGNVPYRSTSDIGLDPGSSSLNSYRSTPSLSSFLRDSAGPEDFGRRYSAGYGARPYYSPADAAARTVPGGTDVLAPQGAGDSFANRRQGLSAPTNLFALESARRQDGWQEQEPATTTAGFQRFQTQSGPLNESLSTSDGTFIRGMSAGLEDVERLTPGESAGVRRQEDRLMLERLREPSRQPLVDLRQDAGAEDRSVLMGNEKYQLDPQGAISSRASLKDAVAARYRLSPMETFTPATDSTPKQEPVRQESRELGTTPAPTLAKHNDFVTRQSGGGRAAPEYALPSQETDGSRSAYGAEQGDVLVRIRQQLDDLSRSVESRLQARPGEGHNAGTVTPGKSTHVTSSEAQPPRLNLGQAGGAIESPDSNYLLKVYEPRVGRETLTPATAGAVFGEIDSAWQNRFESPTTSSLEAAQKIRSLPNGVGELSRAEISAEAKRIIGRHETHDSFAGDKFSQHLRAAENHLKAGEYYKAADSFALASVYRPNDPRALAGRSHALFAAGEYMSSALFLSRALAISPEYVKVRVDFVTLLGGPNRLAGRTADIEQWLAQSGSGQLQLLLGYIYYQTGRLNEAKRAIEAARAKMPDSPAVSAINAAISDSAAIQ